MGFDLYPRRKNVEPVSFNGFMWAGMMDTGIGLVIGAGDGGGGQWFFCGEGENPFFNDGARVSAPDARVMARCASTEALRLVTIGEHVEASHLVKSLKKFAAFAAESGGFEIR